MIGKYGKVEENTHAILWIYITSITFALLLVVCLKPDESGGIAFLAFSGFLLYLFLVSRCQRELKKIVLVAFFLRAALALVQAFAFSLPDSAMDAVYFEDTAWQMAELWRQGEIVPLVTGADFYPYILSFFYALFGRSQLIMQSVNVLCGSLTVYFTASAARELFNRQASIIAGWLSCCFPVLLLYSVITMREAMLVALLSAGFWYLCRYLRTQRVLFAIVSVFLIFLAGLFHSGITILVIGPLLLLAARGMRYLLNLQVSSFIMFFIAGFLLLSVLYIPLSQGRGVEYLGSIDKLTQAETYQDKHHWVSQQRAGYLPDLQMTDIQDVIRAIPAKLLYFMYAPLPWQVENMGDLLAAFDGLLFLLMTISIIPGLREINRSYGRWTVITVILMLGLGLLVYAMGSGNYGQAIRHRNKLSVIFIMLASFQLNYMIGHIKAKRSAKGARMQKV